MTIFLEPVGRSCSSLWCYLSFDLRTPYGVIQIESRKFRGAWRHLIPDRLQQSQEKITGGHLNRSEITFVSVCPTRAKSNRLGSFRKRNQEKTPPVPASLDVEEMRYHLFRTTVLRVIWRYMTTHCSRSWPRGHAIGRSARLARVSRTRAFRHVREWIAWFTYAHICRYLEQANLLSHCLTHVRTPCDLFENYKCYRI